VQVGWWAGFGLAGVGMLAGFVVFVLGKPLLMGKGEPPSPKALKEKVLGPINRETVIYALSLIGIIGVYLPGPAQRRGRRGPDRRNHRFAGLHRCGSCSSNAPRKSASAWPWPCS
jgi:hypothetical protein